MIFLAFAQSSIQLVPDGTIFLHIALILFMIWILNQTLFKPINRILEGRDQKTGGRTGNAQELLREVDDKMLDYERSLRQARTEGHQIVENTRSQALANRLQQTQAVKSEVEMLVANEKADLQQQVIQARNQLQTDAQVLAKRISANLLQRPVNETI
jgi:F-type H+-transporting ATPase subunit b